MPNLPDILVCPECQGDLGLRAQDESSVLACSACLFLYPVIDGIPVLLPRTARNPDLEGPALSEFLDGLSSKERNALDPYVAETEAVFKESPGTSSWEWEDEAFWTKEYDAELCAHEEKNWSERNWEREDAVNMVFADAATFSDRTILDVGAGEGQTFRFLLAPRCPPSTTYVAADISLAALRVNRQRNPHENSIFVLCSASKLPVREDSIDLLCYWGILHHTEHKEETIERHSALVKSGGCIVLYEALERPTMGGLLRRQPGPDETSADEERLDPIKLDRAIESLTNFRVLLSRPTFTAFYGGAMRGRVGDIVASRKPLFRAVATVDRVLVRAGPLVPYLRAARP